MPTRLNASNVAKLKPRDGNYIEYDTVARGFGVRVTPAGAKSYVLTYRVKGQQRRMTIARVGEMDVLVARREAQEHLVKIARGADPLDDLHRARAAPTMAALAERYIEEHVPTKRPRSQEEDISMLRVHILPALRSVRVEDVTYARVCELHRKITKKGKPTRANAVVRLLSKMFSLSIRWGYRTDNPCTGTPKNVETPRERYLSPEETGRLWKAINDLEDQEAARAIWLALMTGARRGELLRSTWAQFDLEAGTWTKPSSHTKQKRTHHVPLSQDALQLLRRMRDEAGEREVYLFPTRAKFNSIRSAFERVRLAAGVPDVHLHDLRHTYASTLINRGSTLAEVGRLLGHTQAQTTMRYIHFADKTLREATERAGQELSASRKRALARGGKSATS